MKILTLLISILPVFASQTLRQAYQYPEEDVMKLIRMCEGSIERMKPKLGGGWAESPEQVREDIAKTEKQIKRLQRILRKCYIGDEARLKLVLKNLQKKETLSEKESEKQQALEIVLGTITEQ